MVHADAQSVIKLLCKIRPNDYTRFYGLVSSMFKPGMREEMKASIISQVTDEDPRDWNGCVEAIKEFLDKAEHYKKFGLLDIPEIFDLHLKIAELSIAASTASSAAAPAPAAPGAAPAASAAASSAAQEKQDK